jgi:hypothetical protein
MKTRAMVGFTRAAALAWIAHEALVRGEPMMVSAHGSTVWIGNDRYVILWPSDSISEMDRILFDEIIERGVAA